jgi:CelD/BcsL family acetyltransferase involved in cellulose biosynthesis
MIDPTFLVSVMLMRVAYPGMGHGLREELADDEAVLGPHLEAWDALAVAAGRPYCAPAWMLSWWRELAPPGARLRVALAFQDEELVGVAPCWSDPGRGPERLRFLAAPLSFPTGPVAAPGHEARVAPRLAAVLAGARPSPRLLVLEGEPEGSPWPGGLAAAWPGVRGAALRPVDSVPAPCVPLAGFDGFDAWFAARSGNFRSQVRQGRRRLDEGGARARQLAEPAAIAAALPGMARLHHARRESRGGSEVLDEPGIRMLCAAAAELAPAGRLWMSHVEGPDTPVAALLFVAAGRVAAYWNGGFDDGWARARPGLVALVGAVEEALRRGHAEVDLGPGGQHYKGRLADERRDLLTLSLRPRDMSYPVTRLRLAPGDARARLAASLSQERKERIKRLLRGGGGSPHA